MSFKPLAGLHTHATLCDGADTLPVMAKAAYDAGLAQYGVTCHSHTPAPFDVGHTLPRDMSAYWRQVGEIQSQYKDKMDVLLGLEWDATSDVEPQDVEGLDYWIGSVHNLYDPNTQTYHAIDWDAEKLQACIDGQFGGNALAMVAEYYRMVSMVAQKKPPILGHFDLIVKLNQNCGFFDENDVKYQKLALSALDAVDVKTTLLEVNSGALHKYGRIYPAPFLLQAWQEKGGRIVLTSDAHSATAITAGMEESATRAQRCGFSNHWIYTKTGWECKSFG